MKVSIIGSGIVGEATGKSLHKFGNEITFYDIDQQKLERLAEQGYRVTEHLEAINGNDIHIICVPTLNPVNNKPDLTCLESALEGLANTLYCHEEYQVIIIRSTLLPFTTRTMVIPFLDSHCRLTLNEDYGICYNPEFLREEHFLDDSVNPPITVIGENDTRSGDIVAELYAPFQSPQIRTTTENAEAIKCFSNAYNAVKISFFNKLYLIAKSCGLDHEIISQTMPKSTTAIRLPEYGIKGGYPYGGKCLPKDLAAVIRFINERDLGANFFEEVAKINDEIGNIYASS